VEHTQTAKDQLLQETQSFKKYITHLEQQASKSATSLAVTEKHVLKITTKLNTAQKELEAKPMHTVVPAVKLQLFTSNNANLVKQIAILTTNNTELMIKNTELEKCFMSVKKSWEKNKAKHERMIENMRLGIFLL
jgi:hypothetical protein